MAIPGNFLSLTTESVDPNTSGWRTRLNCAISLGTGGRNGPGTLRLTSTASGEMQAQTLSAYPVTAGEMYYTLADASSASQPERIGIEWLNDAYTAVGTITWSLTTDAASASWHRISVAGICPIGATRARVILSSTPAGGGVTHDFENVYLGRPIRTTGNLLGFNAESSGELDGAAWTPETNGTVSRVVPVFTWGVTSFQGGGHVMVLTATAGGNTSMTCTDMPAATPGTEYLAYTYLGPPTTGSSAWIELRFHDAVGALIQAVRGPLAPVSTGLQRQRVSAIAPAGTATCSVAAGIDGATAGQKLRVEGTVIEASPVLRTGSVVPYADSSFEQGAAGWSITSGPATIARSAPWASAGSATAVTGQYSLTVTSATTGVSVLRSARLTLGEGAGGLTWRTEAYLNVTGGAWKIRRRVRWYNDAGIEVGTSSGSISDVATILWPRIFNSYSAPLGATAAELEYELTAVTASSVLQVDLVSMWQDLPLMTAATDDATASITVTLRELIVGRLLTVWRVGADGVRTLVRGPDGLYDRTALTSDLLVIEDYEAPLGVPVTYRVEIYDGTTGALAEHRTSSDVTITPGDSNLAWLKDPGNPQRNCTVVVQRPPDWSRAITQADHRIRGRRNPVVLSDVRGGLEGELAIWTRDDAERRRLHWLLDSGNVLLWQAVPGMGVDDMYVAVGEVGEARLGGYAREPWRAWTLPLRQVDMPVAVGISGSAGRTWQDVLSEFATWGDLLTAYATWEDVLFNNRVEAA